MKKIFVSLLVVVAVAGGANAMGPLGPAMERHYHQGDQRTIINSDTSAPSENVRATYAPSRVAVLGPLHRTGSFAFLGPLHPINRVAVLGPLHKTGSFAFLGPLHPTKRVAVLGPLHRTGSFAVLGPLHSNSAFAFVVQLLSGRA
jgi:hypothetical protein